MAVFRSLYWYRLLAIISTLCLKLNNGIYAHQAINDDIPIPERFNSESSKRPRGIEASIFVHPDSSTRSTSSGSRDAEVEVLVRSLATKDHNPHAEGLIRASSIMMEYDEDTRKYLQPKGNGKHRHHHRMRHKSHKHVPYSDDYFAANDAPLPESDPLEESSSETKPRTKLALPLRSLDYGHPNRRKVPGNEAKSEGNGTWISLHSPVRIFIPVRFHGAASAIPTTDKCVQCSDNITLTATYGKTYVEVPPPAISICPRLAREKGRINVAVTVGPRPGTKISEGHYPVELIIWKPSGNVYTCHYTLKVIVQRCKEIPSPEKGSVSCSNGTLFGSRCHFSCDSNYVLQGNSTLTCDKYAKKVFWSSHVPVCKKVASKPLSTLKSIPCLKPHPPTDGTVVCGSNGKNVYPHGSVCQFYCYPGFLIKNHQSSNTLVVCKNGKWTPNQKVVCLATYCSEPKTLHHGSSTCNKDVKDTAIESKYKNGTICNFQCDSGYVIPKSQKHLSKIICNAPYWNDSTMPECKQIFVPIPHEKDCQNTTVIANRRGFAKIKPPRFYLKKLSSTNKELVYGKCNRTNKLEVGFYVNHCSAYNSEFNSTGSCTFSITVKKNSCPPLADIPHSVLKCNNKVNNTFPRRTVCNYICNDGFVIPMKQKKFSSKTCIPKKLIWLPDGVPSCKRAEPPVPKKHSCVSQTLFLNSDELTVKLKLPRFKSSLKGGKVKVKCSLNGSLAAGNYTNKCEAKDKQLGLTSSCEYNITVKVKGCSPLTSIPSGSINCTTSAVNGHYPIGTFCSYECDTENVFPTNLLQYSSKACVDQGMWNSSLIPACFPLTPPTPEFDSCLSQIIEIKDLESFEIIAPKFKSAVGAMLEVECQPPNITTYDVHNISCTAFDPELRVTGFCSFQVEVQNPNGIEELSREEISCKILEEIENGVIECQYSESKLYAPGTLCEVICDDGFVVPLSSKNSSLSLCLSSGQWNTSYTPDCIKTKAPVLTSGCKNDSINISDLKHVNFTLPTFLTAQDTSANVSCIPDILTEYGTHEISCVAYDNDLNTSTACDFVLHLINDKSEDSTATPTIVPELSTSTTSDKTFKPCPQLILPNRGIINCSEDKPVDHCNVGCLDGYVFSSKYKTLRDGVITCDGTDGQWDYQKDQNTTKLPDCLGHLPNTSVNVWMSFTAIVNECDNILEDGYQKAIKASLIGLNEEMCRVVDCESHLKVNCTGELVDNKTVINVNWTLQMAFKPPGPREIPDYEKNIEKILDTTHDAIDSSSDWRRNLSSSDIEVSSGSFGSGKFRLVCDEDGYAVDYNTEKCVECPHGFFEKENACVPCPAGQFQLNTGQTSCELCSVYTGANTAVLNICSG